MNTWIYIIVGIVILMIASSYIKSKGENIAKDLFQKFLIDNGFDVFKFIKIQKYIGGHPEISTQKENIDFYPTKEGFDIYETNFLENADFKKSRYELKKIGSLLNSEIKDILVENKFTIEKRLSVSNIALFGVFGLAMRKTKTQDISFLTIKTSDGRFNNEILFLFEVTEQDLLDQKSKIMNENIKNRSRSNEKPLTSFELANELKNKLVTHLKSL